MMHNCFYAVFDIYPPYVGMVGTKFAVFFVCPVMSATVALIGVKFCMVVHIAPGQVFCVWERCPQVDTSNPKCWA